MCAIFDLDAEGTITGTLSQLSQVSRCSPAQLQDAISELKQTRTADIVTEGSRYTITCRRMQRDLSLRKLRAAAGRLGGISAQAKVKAKPKQNPEDESDNEVDSDSDSEGVARGNPSSQEYIDRRSDELFRAHCVLAYLNERAGRNFRADCDAHIRFIRDRLREPGVTVDEIKKMIDRQVAMWRGGDMEKFLRPETLFNKTKFASYYDDRNQPTKTHQSVSRANPRNVGITPDPRGRSAADVLRERAERERAAKPV